MWILDENWIPVVLLGEFALLVGLGMVLMRLITLESHFQENRGQWLARLRQTQRKILALKKRALSVEAAAIPDASAFLSPFGLVWWLVKRRKA